MLPIHEKIRPQSKYIRQDGISIKRVDSIWDELTEGYKNIFLKVDAQGYEYKILQGAYNSLKKLKGIQLELSLTTLYKEEKILCEIINYLSEHGFSLMSIEPGTVDWSSGRMFQVDGIFFRE